MLVLKYNITAAGLQIIVAIAIRLELYFMDLVGKIAILEVLHPMLIVRLGLSISPANSPNPLVLDSLQPNSIALVVRRRSWAPKPDTDDSISVPFLQNPFNSTHPKREQRAAISSFSMSFLARFGRFRRLKHQIWRFSIQFGGKSIGFGEISAKSG